MGEPGPLKLRAHDRDDLAVVAGVLQDALVPVAEIAYLAEEKRFVMVASRFCWESVASDAAEPEPEPGGAPERAADARFAEARAPAGYRRVNCGVCFDRVRRVRRRGLDPAAHGRILELLTIAGEDDTITLVFAGAAEIRLEVTGIACHIEDLGDPWPTPWRPRHDLDSDARAG